MQTNKLKTNIELTHTTNQNSALSFSGGRSKNGPPLWGNLLENVFLLRFAHREEDGLEDVDVQFERHNMALNGVASNDGTPLEKTKMQ